LHAGSFPLTGTQEKRKSWIARLLNIFKEKADMCTFDINSTQLLEYEYHLLIVNMDYTAVSPGPEAAGSNFS